MSMFDRVLRSVGLQRIDASLNNSAGGFRGASQNRLNWDWAVKVLSADQRLRGDLVAMRSRSRELACNNDYAIRFLNLARQNVIGSCGIGLQVTLDETLVPNAKQLNRQIEDTWARWSEAPSACGQMSWVDYQQLWIASFLQDGETFHYRIKGYPDNAFRYAVQFLDPDQVDVNYNRLRRVNTAGQVIENEIRMGVEFNEYRRPLNYWAFNGHPSEYPGVQRVSLPAERLTHSFAFKFINQSRGTPWMHAAMADMNMLGGYEEAELVAARLAACKMAAIVSKTGDDEYHGKRNKQTGAVEISAEPASMFSLPEGHQVQPIDWNHPNAAFPDFTRAVLRGLAVGINVSYSSLTGDLRDVNFSSIRHGVLDERDGWRVLQTFAIQHLCAPTFRDWLPMAITSGQLALPPGMPLDMIFRSCTWTPRGWDWVDPVKDGEADIQSTRAGMNTLADVAAKRGKDWRDLIDQRAIEIAYAREKGVPIDLTAGGSGGVEGDAAEQESAGETPDREGGNKPGKSARMNYMRLEQ